MTYKSEDNDSLIEIRYTDGKPHRVKKDPLKEIKDELAPEKPEQIFDDEKRALYGDLPQAGIKRDLSITARSLNQTLESFNKRRLEAKFSLSKPKMPNLPYYTITFGISSDGSPEWIFKWDFANSKITTVKRPSNGYNIEWTSPKLSKFNEKLLPEIYKTLENYIRRKTEAALPKTKQGLKNYIYNQVSTKGIFRDEYWKGYRNILDKLKSLGLEVISGPTNDNRYSAGYSADGKEKSWDITIKSKDGVELKGYVKAQAAGSSKDPFDAYDIIFVLF